MRSVPTEIYGVARAKISDGKSVKVAVPEKTVIEAGSFYELGGFFGSATTDVKTESGETSEVVLTIEQAEYETDQIQTTKAFKPGDLIYFTAGKFTPDAGVEESSRPVGRVTVGKDQNNVIWFILGPQL